MRIRSIKSFLVINLLLSVLIVSSITVIGDSILNVRDIRAQQDQQLISTAHILAAVVAEHESPTKTTAPSGAKDISHQLQLITKNEKQDQLEYEVINEQGTVVLHSTLPLLNPTQIRKKTGLTDINFDNKKWRSYSYITPENRRVIISQEDQVRDALSHSLITDNIFIILLTYPLIGLAIWFFIKIALRSFDNLTREMTNRAPSYLEPVDVSNLPSEIFPFADSLNNLFFRLKLSIEEMKRFSSNASHELQTPLAAIKTQAEVALSSLNTLDRNMALTNVLIGVDRASHVVKQLLTLSRLDPDRSLNNLTPIKLSRLTAEIMGQLYPTALKKKIDIELETHNHDPVIIGNEPSIGILIRNLIDNAIRYTPEQGEIRISIVGNPQEQTVLLRVTDNGPGIPAEYRAKVFERFFRVLGSQESGSGLGLAIVKQIANLHQAIINLGTPPSGRGLQIDVVFQNKPHSA